MKRNKLNNLTELLAKKGFYEDYEDPFSEVFRFDKRFIETLKCAMSEEGVEKIIDAVTASKCLTAAELFSELKSKGVLHVEPTLLVEEKNGRSGIPSLVLGWGKYLHWFRGYYFQISGTHDGFGSVYEGADRLDLALNAVRNLRYYGKYAAEEYLFVACLIPVLCHFDQGRKLLNEQNTELLNKFIHLSSKHAYLPATNLDNFMQYITVREYVFKPDLHQICNAEDDVFAVRILDDKFCYGLLTVDKHNITFTTCVKENLYRTTCLAIPDWLYIKDEDDCFVVSDRTRPLRIMVRAIMTLAGFRADYMCMYPVGVKRGQILRIDYNLPNKASTWDEIEKYIALIVERYDDNEQPNSCTRVSAF